MTDMLSRLPRRKQWSIRHSATAPRSHGRGGGGGGGGSAGAVPSGPLGELEPPPPAPGITGSSSGGSGGWSHPSHPAAAQRTAQLRPSSLPGAAHLPVGDSSAADRRFVPPSKLQATKLQVTKLQSYKVTKLQVTLTEERRKADGDERRPGNRLLIDY